MSCCNATCLARLFTLSRRKPKRRFNKAASSYASAATAAASAEVTTKISGASTSPEPSWLGAGDVPAKAGTLVLASSVRASCCGSVLRSARPAARTIAPAADCTAPRAEVAPDNTPAATSGRPSHAAAPTVHGRRESPRPRPNQPAAPAQQHTTAVQSQWSEAAAAAGGADTGLAATSSAPAGPATARRLPRTLWCTFLCAPAAGGTSRGDTIRAASRTAVGGRPTPPPCPGCTDSANWGQSAFSCWVRVVAKGEPPPLVRRSRTADCCASSAVRNSR